MMDGKHQSAKHRANEVAGANAGRPPHFRFRESPTALIAYLVLARVQHRMRYIMALLLSVVVTGCGSHVPPERDVKETIKAKDVLGSWRMNTNSLALLVRDGFVPAPTNLYTIDLRADGTCLFQSVESWPRQHRYISATGTWRLEHNTRGDFLNGSKKKNVLRLELPVDGERHAHYLHFARENGALILWNLIVRWTENTGSDDWPYIEYGRGG